MNINDHLNTNCWFDYPNFYTWVAARDGINIIAEIGSWKGHSTSFLAKKLLEYGKNFKIYAIDVWEKWEEYTIFDDSQKSLLEEARMSHKIFEKNVSESGAKNRIMDIQMDSHSAPSSFSDCFFDFVFLDADHKYNVVKKDIELWLPKVRDGGLIAGHDYFQDSCGVKKAVDECLKNVFFIDRIWCYIKGDKK